MSLNFVTLKLGFGITGQEVGGSSQNITEYDKMVLEYDVIFVQPLIQIVTYITRNTNNFSLLTHSIFRLSQYGIISINFSNIIKVFYS